MYTLISTFAIIPTKNRLLTKKKLRLTLTVMEVKTTLAEDCENFNSTLFVACYSSSSAQAKYVIILYRSNKNIIFVYIF